MRSESGKIAQATARIERRRRALAMAQSRLGGLANVSLWVLNRATNGTGRPLSPDEIQRLNRVLVVMEEAQSKAFALATA